MIYFLFKHIPIFSETFSLHRRVNICTYDRAPLYNCDIHRWRVCIIKLMLNVEHTHTYIYTHNGQCDEWCLLLCWGLVYMSLSYHRPHISASTHFEPLLQNAVVFVIIMLIFLSLVSICLLQLLANLFRSMRQKKKKKRCIMMYYLFLQHHITMDVLLDICTNGKKQFFCFQWLI